MRTMYQNVHLFTRSKSGVMKFATFEYSLLRSDKPLSLLD